VPADFAPDDVLLRERHGAVEVLTLNRPARRNALNAALRASLRDAIADVARDDGVRVLVITGSDPAFCAGLDLTEMTEASPAVEPGDMMEALYALDIPVVGAVNGPAVTGGLELALACDVLVASDRARFADTHGRVGVHPGWAMSVELPRLIGVGRARMMSLTGNYVDAATAEQWGLVARVVEHSRLLPETLELAASIAELDPAIAGPVKEMYVRSWDATLGESLAVEARIAGAHRPAYDELEQRRREVLARNRGQL
jgi:enoyl-CoA hydratase/carnithine racemase